MSIEVDREVTDKRRGEGVYDRVADNMLRFKEKGLLFGTSVTVTKNNFKECTSDSFVKETQAKGSRFLFLTEYVPVGGYEYDIAPGDEERESIYGIGLLSCEKNFTEISAH